MAGDAHSHGRPEDPPRGLVGLISRASESKTGDRNISNPELLQDKMTQDMLSRDTFLADDSTSSIRGRPGSRTSGCPSCADAGPTQVITAASPGRTRQTSRNPGGVRVVERGPDEPSLISGRYRISECQQACNQLVQAMCGESQPQRQWPPGNSDYSTPRHANMTSVRPFRPG
jgi:hypothetical protein